MAPEWTPPSWDDLVRQHSARVYRLAYRLTGNQHDAEDLTQEVFVRVFRSLPSYTPGHLRGVAAPDHHQPVPRPGRRRQRIRFEGLGDQAAGLLRDDEPTPAQAFDARHLDTDVQQALEALAPEYRAAVVLCDIEGLSYEEIAATLGVKLGTVRSRIHRGRAQLRAALDHRRPRHPGQPRRGAGHAVMKRHLGERLSALIDGELSDTQRERVLAHLAGCEDCRREAVALRLLKRRMHTLGDAAAGDALTWRLLALAWRPGPPRAPGGPGPPAGGAAPAPLCLVAGCGRGLATAGLGLTGAVFLAGGDRPPRRPEGRPGGGRLHGPACDHHRPGAGPAVWRARCNEGPVSR